MRREIFYPEFEQEKKTQIDSLMFEWKESLPDKEKQIFVEDGFYPYYFSKKPKILFIAKEALEMSKENYINTLFDCYVNEKTVGNKTLNQYSFHKRLLYLAYGILNKKSSLEDFNAMPNASEIGDSFGSESGVSFAFMNISKSSNDKSVQADLDLIDESVAHGTSFIKKEIEILEPDVIITGNIGGLLFKILDKINVIEKLGGTPNECDVCVHEAIIGNKSVPLLDCWHFSNFTKSDFENFYSPICNYLKK